MRRLILKSILNLGRYAVLPVAALACLMLLGWLMIFDRHTALALTTAPIVLSAVPVALALALGILLLPQPRNSDLELDETAAPGLWTIWKELDRAATRSSRSLRIDQQFNASIYELRRYAGLFGRKVTMTVGLPLLMVLDERAIRAIVAHEVAHAELRHTTGGTNLYDFICAAENLFYYADPDRTITGRIASVVLHSLLEWLQKEYRALSRENELAADAGAAARVGHGEMARALILTEGTGARLSDLVFEPLEKEMLGAVRVPTPPCQRILDRLADIRSPDQLAAAALKGPKREPDPDPTHPPFATRLANLGYTDIPTIDPVESSALGRLLSPDSVKDLPARFDDEWRKKVRHLVSIGS